MNHSTKRQAPTAAGQRYRSARFTAERWFFVAALIAGGVWSGIAQRTAARQLDLNTGEASNAAVSAAAPEDLTVSESFTGQTKDHDYRFTLDGSADMVHLHVATEIHHGKIVWELVDPRGQVRSHIGITEHGSMDTINMKTIKGEWLLRVKLEDATGKYDIHWTQ